MGKRLTAIDILEFKPRGEKIAALTAYDYFTAKFLDRAGIDLILVGDSMNMVIYGEETTLTLDIEQSVYHTRAVAKAAQRAMVVGDMPFMSYQPSARDAVLHAGLLIRAGAQAVKIEGGRVAIKYIKAILETGIPVMGHIGMTPQSFHKFGGYKLIGKTEDEAKRVIEAAIALSDAGVFSLVLEKIPRSLAKKITESIKIPTIGIGAGPDCDGQILVINDIIGMFDEFSPKFARKYADIASIISKSAKTFVSDVKTKDFPNDSESYD
jgi:3-methyl-2-oxobutanoate hydroxymethyltransferase